KLRQLKEARGWPDAGFEERAFALLQDEQTAALDTTANDLLAKLDHLGTVAAGGAPGRAQLAEPTATRPEPPATVQAKAAYTLGKIDQMLAAPPKGGDAKGGEAKRGGDARGELAEARKAAPPEAKAPSPPRTSGWSTETKGTPRDMAPHDMAMAQPA